jgi:hypothetical protein
LGDDFFHTKIERYFQFLWNQGNASRQAASRPLHQWLSLKENLATLRTKKPGSEPKECGFTDPIRAQQSNHVLLLDGERKTVKKQPRTARKRYVAKFKKRRRH